MKLSTKTYILDGQGVPVRARAELAARIKVWIRVDAMMRVWAKVYGQR